MDFVLDFILHIDRYMIEIVRDYHTWTYAILFLIIFCETGLVVTPFLPGDLLFYYLQHSRWSLVGSVVLLCRIFFWRSAFRSEKFEDTDHYNHCRLYITGHNRGILKVSVA